jgi:hemerythrin-like domain-containing protein
VCDYCDCRSHPQIAALSADHEVILHVLVSLRRAVDGGDVDTARAMLTTLAELLDRHARREEGGVFMQLRRADVDGEYVDRFELEHDELDRLLGECAGPGWRQPALQLAALLGDHIAREESDLFPAAHQLLRPDQWDAVDAADAAAQAS